MAKHTIAYIELPSTNVAAQKSFYGELFGWTFEDWGPDYASLQGAGIEGGFNEEADSRTTMPLVIVQTTDIVATEARVRAAGAVISKPIFRYPGGQRFHFIDPSGNELGVMQPDA